MSFPFSFSFSSLSLLTLVGRGEESSSSTSAYKLLGDGALCTRTLLWLRLPNNYARLNDVPINPDPTFYRSRAHLWFHTYNRLGAFFRGRQHSRYQKVWMCWWAEDIFWGFKGGVTLVGKNSNWRMERTTHWKLQFLTTTKYQCIVCTCCRLAKEKKKTRALHYFSFWLLFFAFIYLLSVYAKTILFSCYGFNSHAYTKLYWLIIFLFFNVTKKQYTFFKG